MARITKPAPTMGWEAKVEVWPGLNRPPISAPGLFRDWKSARTWVEAEVLAQIAMEVPVTTTVGRVRFGAVVVDRAGGDPHLDPDSVAKEGHTYTYAWNESGFAWREELPPTA
ncbi:hypothetical protein [Nonomuraea sp. LPB2021202275-12-8]|uniref:hypothetical protein n=1 Tax=Nonomuraea sp. LPB2021202275-12-8 TaxID=3120159 RepID=UPI00300CC773